MQDTVTWFAEQLAPRFKLLATLALGANRATALVHDQQTGSERVLKLRRGIDVAARQELRQEFERLLGLAHPRLVRPYEVIYLGDGEVVALSLEYVPGGNVRQLIGKLSPLQALQVGRAVAEGLEFLHRRQVWHGDIKPENLLIPDSVGGRGNALHPSETLEADINLLRIADFGLSTLVGESLGGATPGFLPPEIASGAPYDARSELFALGMVIWELLVGQTLPVKSTDPIKIARSFKPIPPSQLNPTVDRSVDSFALKALATAPDLRFGSAGEFLEEIGKLIEYLGGGHRPRGAARLLSSPWIERPQIRGELAAAVRAGKTVLLVGAPGCGKSVLLDWLERSLKLNGRSVWNLLLRPTDRDQEPFERLAGSGIESPEAGTAPGKSAGTDDRESGGHFDPIDIDSSEAQSRAEYTQDLRTTALIQRLASSVGQDERAVLIVDDVDRLPPGSRLLLRRLVGEEEVCRCTLVLATRPAGVRDANHPARLALDPAVTTVEIAGLSDAELNLAVTTDFSSGGKRSELLGWLKERAAGTPGRLVALLDQAGGTGAVQRRKGGFAADPHRLAELPELPTDSDLGAAILTGLDAASIRLLETLAILGGESSRDELVQLTDLPPEEFGRCFRNLLVARFLDLRPNGSGTTGLIGFGPGLRAPMIVERLPAKRLRELHAAAAERTTDPLQRFHHLHAAGDRHEAAVILLAIARLARGVGDARSAAAHYATLLRLIDLLPADERVDALDETTQAASATAAFGLAIDACRRLRRELEAGERQAWASLQLVGLLLNTGLGRPEALELIAEVHDTADALKRPGLKAHALLYEGLALVQESDVARAVQLFEEVIAISREMGEAMLEHFAHHRLGFAHYAKGDFVMAERSYRKAIAIARQHQREFRILRSEVGLAITHVRLGRKSARQELKRLLKRSRELGHLDTAANIVTHLSLASLREGAWAEARLLLDEQLLLSRRRGHANDEMVTLWGQEFIERYAGSLSRGMQILPRAISIAESIPDNASLCMMLSGLAQDALLSGQLEVCEEAAQRSIEIADAHHQLAWGGFARLAECGRFRLLGRDEEATLVLAPVVEHLRTADVADIESVQKWAEIARFEIADGNLTEAREILQRLESMSEHLDIPWARALTQRVEAHLTATKDRDADPIALYASALSSFGEAGLATDRWLAVAELGRHLLDRGVRRESVGLCRRAVERLEQAREGLAIAGADHSAIQAWLLEAHETLYELTREAGMIGHGLLDRMVEILSSIQDINLMLDRALDLVAEVVGADRGVLLLRNRRTGRLEIAAARGVPRRTQLKALSVSRTVIRDVLHSGDLIVTSDASMDDDLRDRESVRLHEIRGLSCVPLSVEGNVFGALYVDRTGEPGFVQPGIRAMLKSIAACLSMAIHNAWIQLDQISANARLRDRNLELAREVGASESREELVGSSAAMLELREQIQRLADGEGSVLIVGEAGTGKDLVASALHRWSSRRDEAYLTAALATMPDSFALATLVGRAGGPAQGNRATRGLLEMVGRGTLLIDDVTELGGSIQKSLLDLIERQSFSPQSSAAETTAFGGRLLFAAQQQPQRAVQEGRLGEDLYQRISTHVIEVPPLRERRQDVPELIEHFVRLSRRRLGLEVPGPLPEFIEACIQDSWADSNVRELRNVVEQAMNTVREPENWMSVYHEHVARRPGALPIAGVGNFQERMRGFERSEISRALRAVNWNQAAAARLLSMPEATLRYKVKTLGIEIQS